MFVQTAALALLSLASASAQAGGSGCHATPQGAPKEVPWAGNTGEIQWSADKPDCKVEPAGTPWVSVSVVPPGTGDPTLHVLRYSVNTNFTPSRRQGKIQIGDATVTIEQAAGPAPGMAFAPSRLEIQFTPGKDTFLETTKMLYVGSEEPLTYTASVPDKAASWVKIKPAAPEDNGPRRQRTFEIVVSAVGKDPGVYQTDILLESPGAANTKEMVPVTMMVGKGK
jgi:hypothetical protein